MDEGDSDRIIAAFEEGLHCSHFSGQRHSLFFMLCILNLIIGFE